MFGDEKDWQLRQAVNYLKGEQVVSSQYRGKPRDVVKKLKAAEAEKKAKAKENGDSDKDSTPKKSSDE